MLADAPPPPRRLIAASGGFLGPSAQARRIRRILDLAGHKPRIGLPRADDAVIAWGHSPRAWRAEALAQRSGAALWRVEDAFIRSVHPGRAGGEPPMGLLLDRTGMHYDPSRPSDLESLLARHPLDDAHLLARARLCIARMRHLHLTKYNAHDPDLPPPDPGYVLVLDQVRGDASLTHGAEDGPLPADRLFREMLLIAQEENPGARVLIRAHPETRGGHRAGHYGAGDANLDRGGRVGFADGAHSPWALLEGAVAVYSVSSQMGFEAILAGHKPRVFGQPFYAGWGLTQDEQPPQRRRRTLTRTQLFAGAMMLYPLWYDPLRDRLCALEEVIDQMEARLAVFRQDRAGYVALGMRLWKRPAIQGFLGRETPVIFASAPDTATRIAAAKGRRVIGWASAMPEGFAGVRVEDGFLRSRGLGADLVPPLSLVLDDLGIHYDPSHESRLERLISAALPPGGAERAEALRAAILRGGVTKYNLPNTDTGLGARVTALRGARPGAPVLLVPGQVEDDASIRLGTHDIRTNRALLEAARAAHPQAIILFKPHPDVEAGLRPGAVADAEALADLVLHRIDAAQALTLVDRVWTMTSGIGFEALLRDVPVTCLGTPFYAGWGLTEDRGWVPERRRHIRPRPNLDHLVHAVLIGYPRYLDPLTNVPCPPEIAVDRLARGQTGRGPLRLRALGRLQGALAGFAWLWR
jgi:capsular polysaccharide export protein